MSIVNTFSLQSNRQIKINFNGGDLSSDAGLLLIKEFAAKIGFTKLIKKKFKTNDKSVRFHKDHENLLQMIYQVISAYFQDDCADRLIVGFKLFSISFVKPISAANSFIKRSPASEERSPPSKFILICLLL